MSRFDDDLSVANELARDMNCVEATQFFRAQFGWSLRVAAYHVKKLYDQDCVLTRSIAAQSADSWWRK